jgi:glycosyltransferase involved in cell wall biosynthesis
MGETTSNNQLKFDFDVICFSHLRWDFVYQRPQHLMSRFARQRRVFVFEEPVFTDEAERLDVTSRGGNVHIAVPKLPRDTDARQIPDKLRTFLDELIESHDIRNFLSWYYTPMMFEWSDHLQPAATVYDCMDQLSAFKNAPPELTENEAKLLKRADLVFTGGQSLYEAKKESHPAVYAFPSSIDVAHFARASAIADDPADLAGIARPRIGFVGVIDERMDIGLLDQIAENMPEWQFVMIGPVVKIDESELPRRKNIHYLGPKTYDELPDYIGRWDVAMMPFAMNESTRYISPTKTPEYLAAGLPVVSTPIRDVVRPYGEKGLVHIAATADEFIEGIGAAMNEDAGIRKRQVDAFLSNVSWDSTFAEMSRLIDSVIETHRTGSAASAKGAGFS